MQIEFTLASPRGDRDVQVTAPDAARLEDILPPLAATAGLPAGVRLWAGDRELDRGQAFASAGLRTGAVVRTERPAPGPGDGGRIVRVTSGPDAGALFPLRRGPMSVGRDEDCDIRLTDPAVSRRHAVVEVRADGVAVHDAGSANGNWLGGRRVEDTVLRSRDTVRMGDSLLDVAIPDTTPALIAPGPDATLRLLRSPRPPRSWPAVEIVLPERESAPRPRGVQWVAAMLPAALGVLLAWLWDAPQFLLFALLSPTMMIATALGDRWHWRRSRRRADADLRRRRALAKQQLDRALTREARQRRSAAPDPDWLRRIATTPDSRLWERRRPDEDFLQLRLGTGQLPSSTRIRRGSGPGVTDALQDVPVCIDLRCGSVGVGLPPDQRLGVARWLIGQLAALHAPTDVELILLLTDPQAWAWTRWLPHLRGRVGLERDEWAFFVDGLAARTRPRHDARHSGEQWTGRWTVLLVDRASVVAEATELTSLLATGHEVGIAVICLDDDVTHLPTVRGPVVRAAGESGTRLSVEHRDAATVTETVADQVTERWASEVARSLAPLVDTGSCGDPELPERCSLLSLLDRADLDTDTLAERWARSAGTARTMLGVDAGSPLTIDLATDGPHALIAGTTGSGKSELLRSLVVGLAIDQPPDELTFLLVDYKGGAAFAECVELPHTVGLVTDLDQYLTERVLRSLRAELRRREHLLAQQGCADLTAYRATSPAVSVPRLVVVVDEFATLAEELPDFIRGLVAVAQRGRSLGLHLVLATQRPGSAVSPEIRANISLRVALRMTDPVDSQDVIDCADAAFIEPKVPGRAYLRSGAAVTAFQAAYVSGVTPPDPARISVQVLEPWRRRGQQPVDGPSDLTVLVRLIRQAATNHSRRAGPPPWHPPLPEVVPRTSLGVPSDPRSVRLGLVDRPESLEQCPWDIDLARAPSLLVAGAPGSGRTTSLVSLAVGAAARLGPDVLALYVIDARGELVGALRQLPHCATALGPNELALVPRLLHRLALVSSSAASHPPALLLIDDWPAMMDSLGESAAVECSTALTGLLRAGPSIGLTIAVTGDRSALLPRFAAGFATRLVLRLTDRLDYGLTGVAARDVPASLPAGRGIRTSDGALVQLAVPDSLRDTVAVAAEQWSGTARPPAGAVRVRALPDRLALGSVPARPGRIILGLGGDTGEPIAVAPFDDANRLLVAGPPRSGRTTVLRLLLGQARAQGLDVLVAGPARSELLIEARSGGLPCLDPMDTGIGWAPPDRPTLLLVDDCEAFADSTIGDQLTSWLRTSGPPLAAAVAGRSEDLALTYRGLGAEARRGHCGVLLRPGALDGELLGVRLPRWSRAGRPGHGVVVGPSSWGAALKDGEPVPIQVAQP